MKFDGDNTYPDCEQCGHCCEINALCMTAVDYEIITCAIKTRGISPINYNGRRCCFQNEDRTCMIWDVRPQVCRLHNCHIPRHRVLEMDPSIEVDEDLWLVDLHRNFVVKEARQ